MMNEKMRRIVKRLTSEDLNALDAAAYQLRYEIAEVLELPLPDLAKVMQAALGAQKVLQEMRLANLVSILTEVFLKIITHLEGKYNVAINHDDLGRPDSSFLAQLEQDKLQPKK